MRIKRSAISVIVPVCCMFVLILDSQTAIRGATEGINLCIHSVIPSLFPFFILSILLTNAILNSSAQTMSCNSTLSEHQRLTKTLFIIGLLGGYPTGAQAVSEAYKSGQLSKDAARRMLGFCSNAGPAFIFGITGQLFSAPHIPWLLWMIHILSAMIVAMIIPVHANTASGIILENRITIQQAFTKSLHAIACVCGWIILFRVLISFMDRWFLWLLPKTAAILITGILELTNGIFLLEAVESEAIRFICCSVLIAFGGSCVAMQTASVSKELGFGWYFPGKLMQSVVSGILCLISAKWIYGFGAKDSIVYILFAVVFLAFIYVLIKKKISIAFSRNYVYNRQKSSRELSACSFEKR